MIATLAVAALLVTTSAPGPALVNDTRAAVVASWSLGTRGEVLLPEPWPASRNYWGVPTPDGRVAVNRFPGVALWAAPAYAARDLVDDDPPPAHPFLVDPRPAGWTAAITVAAAGAVAYALLRRSLPRPGAALGSAVLVLGTGLWSVAADALWPHGPTALLLLSALLGWRSRRWPLVLVASAAAVLVRPHVAVALAVLTAATAWSARRRPADRPVAAAFAVGTALGLGLLSLYSWQVFAVLTPTAGYDVGAHLGGLVDHPPSQTLSAALAALGGDRGVLRYSPVLAVAAAAAVAHRRALPAWSLAAAGAGVAYLLVQVRAVGPLGGDDFFGARVSLEAVVLAAPLLVTASVRAARARAWAVALALAAVASVGVHAVGAVRGGVDPVTEARWEGIDATVRRDFGDLELGEVDLRRPPG